MMLCCVLRRLLLVIAICLSAPMFALQSSAAASTPVSALKVHGDFHTSDAILDSRASAAHDHGQRGMCNHAASRADESLSSALGCDAARADVGTEITAHVTPDHDYDLVPRLAQVGSVSNQRRGPPKHLRGYAAGYPVSISWFAVAAKTPGLKSLASEVREAGLHPAARNNRTIAVGIDADGGLFAGSSNGFDAGQRAALARLGITRVPGSGALHAEEELLRGVPTLQRVGTSVRAPCGASEHNCALQLIERGVGVE